MLRNALSASVPELIKPIEWLWCCGKAGVCGDEVGSSSPAAFFIPAIWKISSTSHTRFVKVSVTRGQIQGIIQPFDDPQLDRATFHSMF